MGTNRQKFAEEKTQAELLALGRSGFLSSGSSLATDAFVAKNSAISFDSSALPEDATRFGRDIVPE